LKQKTINQQRRIETASTAACVFISLSSSKHLLGKFVDLLLLQRFETVLFGIIGIEHKVPKLNLQVLLQNEIMIKCTQTQIVAASPTNSSS
jgi:hypothetical protein